MAVKIQIRNGTASEWTAANPILAEGELAIESDTKKFKIGDGLTAWNSLTYATQGEIGPPGPAGPGLEFNWNGTQLGVRIEGETQYQYVNLIGPKGEQGEKGEPGQDGQDGYGAIANNLTTTVEGYALDARQGKTLAEQISNLSAEDVGALPIAGGTLTGYLSFGDSTAYIGRADNVFDFVKGGMSIRLDSNLSVADGVQIRNIGSGALYKIYSEANVTISTSAPSSALAEGEIHMVY